MNIFALAKSPAIAARLHFDKHVVKMILETAQLLSTAHRILDPDGASDVLYKSTHVNHPCSIWVRSNSKNYRWAYKLFTCLCDEYTYRYKKIHMTDSKLRHILKQLPRNIVHSKHNTEWAQAVPQDIKDMHLASVDAYRMYYKRDKWHMLAYTLPDDERNDVMNLWNSC